MSLSHSKRQTLPRINPENAVGLIEVKGLALGLVVVDTISKSADVEIVEVKKELGGDLITIVIQGDVSSVKEALNAGKAIARVGDCFIANRVFANPDEQMLRYLTGEYRKDHFEWKGKAYGIIEVYGFVCAISAADAACKAADVQLVGMERTKGNSGIELIVAVKVEGLCDAVRSAVDAGLKAAAEVGDVISCSVNSRPDPEIHKMVKYTNLRSD